MSTKVLTAEQLAQIDQEEKTLGYWLSYRLCRLAWRLNKIQVQQYSATIQLLKAMKGVDYL